MSAGLLHDVSAHLGVFIAVLLVAVGVIGTAVLLGAAIVVRKWEKSLHRKE